MRASTARRIECSSAQKRSYTTLRASTVGAIFCAAAAGQNSRPMNQSPTDEKNKQARCALSDRHLFFPPYQLITLRFRNHLPVWPFVAPFTRPTAFFKAGATTFPAHYTMTQRTLGGIADKSRKLALALKRAGEGGGVGGVGGRRFCRATGAVLS